MALPSWKTFPFFDVEEVHPAQSSEQEEGPLFDNDTTALATGSDTLFLGTSDGEIRILSSAFKTVRSFKAYNTASVRLLRQIESTSLLVSIAEDLSSEPILKVWALDQTERKGAADGKPRCLSETKISNGRKLFPVSAFAVLQDLTQVAVGFANGAVTVIRGDLIHDRGTKQRTVFESEEPITGLEVREGGITTLYIATTSRIATLAIAGRGQGSPPKTLDNTGCGVGCMTMDKDTSDVIVARDDAIYSYGTNGRGRPYAFEGPKTLVKTYKDYVALVCPPRVAQMSKSKTFRRLGADQMDDLFNTSSFSLLDPDLKFIAHTESLSSQVKDVFSVWGDLFLATIDGKLYRFREKTLQQKLEVLYQRNLYLYAINLAQKTGVDKVQQNIIFRKYGDYLYQKGEYDTAMQQYLRAIDNTEPSQVIRRFLDTQRIHNLIEYLEELHDHDRATADHTTLLLNCYAKLKDTEKLDAFIKAPGELKFDLETAITMCRQGGYFEQAAYLATKHGENDLVVDILIEDSKQYPEALQYIWRMDPEMAYPNLMRYARVLLGHCPKETTQIFIDYYTGNYRPKEDIPAITVTTEVQKTTSGGAMQNLAAFLPLPYMSRSTVASPGASDGQKTAVNEATLADENEIEAVEPLDYKIPPPRSAFSSFVSHPQEFISFLEALLGHVDLSPTSLTDLRTTLFEIYLQEATSAASKADRERYQSKAKSLIESSAASDQDGSTISTSNVLLLSTLSNFQPGKTLIRELSSLHSDIFRSHTNAKDTAGALSAMQKYGPETPSLYLDALTYISSSPELLSEAGGEKTLASILNEIQNQNLLSPLQVIQLLSSTPVITMGMIKSYLSSNIEKERKTISSNRQLISSYRDETEAKRVEIDMLNHKPITFNTKRCAACTQPLELPTLHFMCKHSFHQRCINTAAPIRWSSSRGGEGDNADTAGLECPQCKPANDTIKAIRRTQTENAAQQDLFKAAVERGAGAESRWGVVSEFFGRGVMNTGTVTDA